MPRAASEVRLEFLKTRAEEQRHSSAGRGLRQGQIFGLLTQQYHTRNE
jgi:hypothetical protein